MPFSSSTFSAPFFSSQNKTPNYSEMKNQIIIFAQGIYSGDAVDGLTVPGTPWASFFMGGGI